MQFIELIFTSGIYFKMFLQKKDRRFTEKGIPAFAFIKIDCILPAASEGGRKMQPSDLYTGFLRVTELTLKYCCWLIKHWGD